MTTRGMEAVMGEEQGWIEWSGGKCPVAPGAIVDTQHRDGSVQISTQAAVWIGESGCPDLWKHEAFYAPGKHGGDIIAYRVVEPGK